MSVLKTAKLPFKTQFQWYNDFFILMYFFQKKGKIQVLRKERLPEENSSRGFIKADH